MPIVFPEPPAGERTGDEISADIFRCIADKIERDPSLLDIALTNIARWLARGHSSVTRLEGWRTMLLEAKAASAGMTKLLALLRDQSWEAVMWKEFAPFPGILTETERQHFAWTSAH